MPKLPRHLRQDAKLLELAAMPALAECQVGDLVALASAAELVRCARHDLVAFQAEPRRWWWLVVDGELEVLRDWTPPVRLVAGHAVGLDDSPHASAVTVVATKPASVLVASRATITAVMAEHPRLADVVRRASFGSVEQLEDLFRRPSHDGAMAPDHDRALDQHRVGR
jgi:hypothetical protein